MKRILGLDIGRVRIGVAISDPLGTFAQGIDVLEAGKDWMEQVRGLVQERNIGMIVVGVPVRTDGSKGPEAAWVEAVMEKLRKKEGYGGVEIVAWDERFSTAEAERTLIKGDLSRRRRKGVIDKVAATLILQSYLDNRRISS
ncbi:MAG: Holliday junction resolvase RuvX [Thermovirgaceae bacterium]|nr:Holliday junction resolvase RuvX [Synergistales bacterium]MDI9391876.1 Holliday junction resolvase RuvX [Synergistota bacterium]MDY0179552.1 Holliday junction resolvase RuvX [Synergistaceae bacterium]HRW88186.1 Holliday junction resolvase RuvX [Thermovirgaceae bacterium]MDD3133864.1 Holliday junction resolvase RuvX [Synergistales bacterium]